LARERVKYDKWQVTIKDRDVHSRVKLWLCLINLLVKKGELSW
jgi:hypothetical protein